MAQNNGTNNFGVAKWIVDATAGNGTQTTIAAALTASSSGDTIFIRPGTYTENLTLKAGVNLTAFGSDSSLNGTGKVIISGTCTLTAAGSVTISGIQLQTNSAALLAVTGSADSIVNLNNCYLNCTNTTGITFSTSSANARIFIYYCLGDLGTTGIALFSHSSAGAIVLAHSYFSNTGASSTANTCSAGILNIDFCQFQNPITMSSTGAGTWEFTTISTSAQNVISATLGGGSMSCKWCKFDSGTASAVTATGTSNNMLFCTVGSSNTNAVTGAGTLTYQGMSFNSTSKTINTTTQTDSGTLQGSKTKAPSAGYLGEQIVGTATSVAAGTTGNGKTITSISVTAGVWDISTIATGTTGSANFTLIQVGISTTTNTFEGNTGDQNFISNTAAATAFLTGVVPTFRVVITTTTTYYSVVRVDYAAGSPTINARISAVRVA